MPIVAGDAAFNTRPSWPKAQLLYCPTSVQLRYISLAGGLKSDLTIFSRYNKCPNNALAKEFCTFDHHTLLVFLPVF